MSDPTPVYTFLTLDDFPEVRAVIDPALFALSGTDPENPFSDALISGALYLGAAERWLLAKLPNAADYTGDDAVKVRNAIILYTASLLVPYMDNFTKEDFGDYKYSKAGVNTAALAGSLRLRALRELTSLTGSAMPVMFDLACGDRGQ